MAVVIGRLEEQQKLREIYLSGDPELVAVYGRRRIGKTFLIRNFFEKELCFEFSGLHNAPLPQQLEAFALALTNAAKGLPVATPSSWLQAFEILKNYLSPLIKKQRRVIFFDEFPWLASPKSGFMQAFQNFWNTWAEKQANLIVIICGSAASWMIQKVLKDRGGLHNRVTQRIRLLPFTLHETETFFQSRKIVLDRYQITQLYMCMGGVPHYLKEVKPGESASQAIDRTCFSKDGLLKNEFENLYRSLFNNSEQHYSIVKVLANNGQGVTRGDLLNAVGIESGGGATQTLEELLESGFIAKTVPYNKKSKDVVYRLSDEFTGFYLKFIDGNKATGKGTWQKISLERSWQSWAGFAFERVCFKHMPQIKKALGIGGINTTQSSWLYKGSKNEKGCQVDLLIDRADRCINIIEIKFSSDLFEISKSYKEELDLKVKIFRKKMKTKKTLFLTMLTTYGLKNAEKYPGFIQSSITMENLFD